MKDRFGREMVGILATIYSFFRFKRFCRISYDGAWIHKCHDGTIVDPKLNFNSISDVMKESSDAWFHIYKPTRGDIIIDVGAGTGTDTLLFSRIVGSLGKVIAIEAHPKTFLCLAKMCKYNNLKNVVLYNYAITDREMGVLIENSSNHLRNTILNQSARALKKGIEIKGTTLDKLLGNHNIEYISFLKMNIEGAEKLAITGMKNTLKRTRFICIACHDFLNKRGGQRNTQTKDTIIDFLEKNGFKIFTRDTDERDWVRDHVHGINRVLLS
ncbi:FkbM family methyltransferase [Candidatus Bathyarchaeota archaeon]|nr:FkbM family methyltransferase [Candidatus Bathyarchaeota archaeon]